MKIVIVGAGQVGGTLAENLAREYNDITVVDIDGDRLRIAFTDGDLLAYDLAAVGADGFTGDIYDPATTPALLGTTTSLAEAASGSTLGVTLLAENDASPDAGMIAYTTSTYNTGWMNGDIKLATLSDTDATNITFADKQLIDEPYFNASTIVFTFALNIPI
mgnify:CR=1 FL=1